MKALALLLMLLPAPFVAAQQPGAADDRARIALQAGAARVFRGQVVDVTLRVELEQGLLREGLIQLFRQRIDVAVRIDTPWAAPPDGFEYLGPPPGFAGDASAVVDGALAALRAAGEVERDGRRFAVFALQARLLPLRAGELVLPPATLRFAWASRFTEDFFGDRVPEDRADAELRSGPLPLAVAALPAGRPAGFTGLVGRCTLQAAVDAPSPVRVGDALLLRLLLAGAGDLRPFAPPALTHLPAFHVRGLREEPQPGQRAVVYDLVALRAGAQAIAAIEVPFFDPQAQRYDVAASAALAIAVAPAADGTAAIDAAGHRVADAGPAAANEPPAPAPTPGVDVLFGLLPVAPAPGALRPDFADARPLPVALLLLLLLAPWLAFVGLWSLRRRAGTRQQRLRARRQRRARSEFERELAAGGDRGAALQRYLAAWLDCTAAAVVCPRLPQRLLQAGLDPALARELDASLDQLAGARFGGVAGPPSDAALRELVARSGAQLRGARRVHRAACVAVLLALLSAAAVAQMPDAGKTPAADARTAPTPDARSATTPDTRPAPTPDTRPTPDARPSPTQAESSARAPVDPSAQGEDLPARAAQQFAAGDVARAAELYQQALVAGGFDAAALCFDLGNCAHRLGRPAEAVLWYERALRASPGHFEARANLRLVRQQLGLAAPGERALLRVWLDGAVARLGAAGAGTLLLLGAVLQSGGLLQLWLRRRRGPALALVGLGLLLSAFAANDSLGTGAATAVVLRDGVRLQAEPHERAGVLGALQAGESIAVLEASPRWARVRRGADEGWVEARVFERIAVRP